MKWALCFLLIANVNASTLQEAFQSARRNMETLKRADQNIEQRVQQKNRAKAAVLPNISGVGNYTRIDAPDVTGVSQAFTLTKQYSTAIRLTQPLLRGGVIGAYQLAQENILLAEFQKNSSELNLYQLIINSYYNLQIAFQDLTNLEMLLVFSKERVEELRSRTKIGRSRRGELVEAQAQMLAAESQVHQGKIELQEAIRNFEFYTGFAPTKLPQMGPVPKVEGPLEEYLLKLRSRPDIMAAEQQVRAADKQISISKGRHYPSVDLVANYYLDRTGVLATSDWDAAVVFSVPFYQGGDVQAQVKEAVAGKRIAELDSSQTLRAAERELAILFRNYQQIQEQLKTLKAALSKAEEAYALNKKDYNLGLVTNLDLLQSLNIFIQTKRSYDNLYALAHMTQKSLEASIGVLP
jgi:outer membrane protein